MSQPILAKKLISNLSKPFDKAIIEEVTKEHFFTKDHMINRRSSANHTESSFASLDQEGQGVRNFRLRNGRNNNNGTFSKRAQSLPGVKQSEAIKIEIPEECKVLCFC